MPPEAKGWLSEKLMALKVMTAQMIPVVVQEIILSVLIV